MESRAQNSGEVLYDQMELMDLYLSCAEKQLKLKTYIEAK